LLQVFHRAKSNHSIRVLDCLADNLGDKKECHNPYSVLLVFVNEKNPVAGKPLSNLEFLHQQVCDWAAPWSHLGSP
jgi:hypothetical protein